jgi:hypothetical protein
LISITFLLIHSVAFAATQRAQPKGRMIIWQNNFLIILPNHCSAFQIFLSTAMGEVVRGSVSWCNSLPVLGPVLEGGRLPIDAQVVEFYT